eukprot:TCONS_00046718-protein
MIVHGIVYRKIKTKTKMSFYGFKKQFNKTSQFLSEKVAGNKGSQLDEEYVELERKVDIVTQGIGDFQAKVKEYLQPNPNARTRLAMQGAIQKAKGQQRNVRYPQPEFNLGDVFTRAGASLDDGSPYCSALTDLGEAFNQISEFKDTMEYSVKQNFLDPLFQIQQKDLKEIQHHRKKLESRRLDFDYKKGKGAKVPEEELQMAEEKFDESKNLSYNSMMNFMESDVEHVGQLHSFTEAVAEYHKQCAEVMERVCAELGEKLNEAASRPRAERSFISRPVSKFSTGSTEFEVLEADGSAASASISAPVAPARDVAPPVLAVPPPPSKVPSARAIYDFEPENEGELPFNEGDMIELTGRIDENWLEGRFNGHSGYFPENYVEIVVPL